MPNGSLTQAALMGGLVVRRRVELGAQARQHELTTCADIVECGPRDAEQASGYGGVTPGALESPLEIASAEVAARGAFTRRCVGTSYCGEVLGPQHLFLIRER